MPYIVGPLLCGRGRRAQARPCNSLYKFDTNTNVEARGSVLSALDHLFFKASTKGTAALVGGTHRVETSYSHLVEGRLGE